MDVQWRKSSFSGTDEENNCVELAVWEGRVLIRESDAPEVIVTTSPQKLRAFLTGAKAGEFDGLA